MVIGLDDVGRVLTIGRGGYFHDAVYRYDMSSVPMREDVFNEVLGFDVLVDHGNPIMSAMRTSASSIFRIADFSLWLRVAAMTFAEQLSGFTAADLMAAFPGIPRSTAYDWLSGVREPVTYLQPVALAHLRSAKRTPNKSPETTRRKRSVG